MKILFTVVGGAGMGFQSGRPYYVKQALQRLGEVDVLALPAAGYTAKARSRVSRIGGFGNLLPDRSPSLLRSYADMIARSLAHGGHDIVVSSTTLVTAFRPLPVPTVTWADAPITAVLNNRHYPGFSRVGGRRRQAAVGVERSALQNASISAFPSDWAADLALAINPTATVQTRPFGPNLDEGTAGGGPSAASPSVCSDRARVLFNGFDWHRKGGDIALEVVRRAAAKLGSDVHLVVLGLDHPPHVASNVPVTFLGRVSKGTEAGRRTWIEAYAEADVFLFPTRAENYGAVVAEAAACGIPVVVSQVGGAWQSVNKGGFGYTVPAFGSDEVADLTQAVLRILGDRRHAADLGDAGVAAVNDWLNYDSSASALVRQLCRS